MKNVIVGIAGFAITLFSAGQALGQDMPKAHKMENVSWHTVVLVDFEPGKTDEAMNIINNHFVKAAEKAGNSGPAMELEMQTGEWDLMLVWNMDSPSEMEWEVSPEGEKFMKALSEQEGSLKKAQELFDKYQSLIDESTSYIATSDNE